MVLDATHRPAEWPKVQCEGKRFSNAMPGWECQIVPIVLRNGGDIELTMVEEVSVSGNYELKVDRVVVAIDSGHVVNPDTVRRPNALSSSDWAASSATRTA